MKKLKIPKSVKLISRKYKFDESEFVRWILETMDESLLKDAAKNFKFFIDGKNRR